MRKLVFNLLTAMVLSVAVFATADLLTWSPSPSGEAVTGYRVYWATNSDAPKPWSNVTNVSGLSATVPTTPGIRNYYYVVATNAVGVSDPSEVAFRTVPPTGGTISGNGPGIDLLSWKAVDLTELAIGYRVYSTTVQTNAKPWTFVTFVTNVSVSVPVIQGMRNYYYVTTTNAYSESDPGSTVFKPGNPKNLVIQQGP